MQGLAAIRGHGLELVITLETGVGSGLFEDGRPSPHLRTRGCVHSAMARVYEGQLGNKAFVAHDTKRWNKRVERTMNIAPRSRRSLTGSILMSARGKDQVNLPADGEHVPNVLGLKEQHLAIDPTPRCEIGRCAAESMTVFLIRYAHRQPR